MLVHFFALFKWIYKHWFDYYYQSVARVSYLFALTWKWIIQVQ